ncbi:hypothetical protein IE53DRAFT_198236 [Violaceomyces palustris]|uniref:Uncharacterized protein n=1 Tax=Violaceomyces palustris TaxID=1673888 RepID=A0ACD0NRI2_9BASI|nr:hypothetical protein IE53DRAFT_198236 [Violaceomyces palustris]
MTPLSTSLPICLSASPPLCLSASPSSPSWPLALPLSLSLHPTHLCAPLLPPSMLLFEHRSRRIHLAYHHAPLPLLIPFHPFPSQRGGMKRFKDGVAILVCQPRRPHFSCCKSCSALVGKRWIGLSSLSSSLLLFGCMAVVARLKRS